MTARLTAVLGPTNTGKTHLAMERFLAHPSGMIGFPLRLLARENYERAVRAKGARAVALITGEEKIIPPGARHFVCTVEAMPVDRPVAFLAVDEVQLAADPERGHVFTDRILHARGMAETMLLGSDTMRPALLRLLPGIEIISRPRLSVLTHVGPCKLARLPPRTAIVAFSAAAVYEIAELMRRVRGGVAVVMGALSPRTRNAQVALYQDGAVDMLVATDAIGMGLNLDVSHVAFAGLSKFDGRRPRALTLPEIAQIAGRAGRHAQDGSFGTTGPAPPFDPDVVEALETHALPPVETLIWRNPDLDFRSLSALLRSLDRPPPGPGLARLREGDDHRALAALALDAGLTARLSGRADVELLWQVCRIPDFADAGDGHARFLARVMGLLLDHDRQLPVDWLDRQIKRLDDIHGEIDALTDRLARIRSLTYLAHSTPFVPDADSWQARARDVEDRLSDALHEALTRRFIDRRAAGLIRRMAGSEDALLTALSADGVVMIEGAPAGRLDLLDFVPLPGLSPEERRLVATAARRSLLPEINRRARALARATAAELTLDSADRILWNGQPVATLGRGRDLLQPAVTLIGGDWLGGEQRAAIRQRLEGWLSAEISAIFTPLDPAPLPTAAARALIFRLRGGLGHVLQDAPLSLAPADRAALAAHGVRFGRDHIWIDALLKPAALAWRARLWRLAGHRPPPVPPAGRMSVALTKGHAPADWHAIGHVALGGLAIRIDMAERLIADIAAATAQGHFTAPPGWAARIGAPAARLAAVLTALGHVALPDGRWRSTTHRRLKREKKADRIDPDSPFALFKQELTAEQLGQDGARQDG